MKGNKSQNLTLQTIAVYGGALLIGLVLVSFPASSTFFKLNHGFSDQDYGSIFLPQLVFAIVGALSAGYVVQIMSLKNMYLYCLGAFVVSQMSLCLSLYVSPDTALVLIMFATACFGFGFGFGGGPINGLVYLLFPNKTGPALSAMHMMAGVGLMSGPFLFRTMIDIGNWVWAPAILVGLSITLLALVVVVYLPGEPVKEQSGKKTLPYKSAYFWLILAVGILYAFSEGTFSNWAIIYISETRTLSTTIAAAALSAFWGGITIGRLLVSFVLIKFKSISVWILLSLMLIPAFLLVANAATPSEAILAFGFAGLACSAFFPIMVAVAAEAYPHAVSWIASMLTAAMMIGVGLGSFGIGNLKETISLEEIYSYSTAYPILILVLILLCIKIRKRYVSI